jgi:fatty acid desaturase
MLPPDTAPAARRSTVIRLRRQFRAAVRREAIARPAGRVWLVGLGWLGHVGLAAGAALASRRLFDASIALGLVGLPLAWIVIGSRFRAIGNMMHECTHRTFLPGRRWNRAFGHFLGFFDFTDFAEYADEHATHHADVGGEGDLDARARRPLFDALGPLGRRHLTFGLALRHLPHYVRPVLFRRTDGAALCLARIAFLAGLAALAHFGIGWSNFLLYYVVPYLTTYQMFRFFSDAADHGGITSEADEFLRSRNHIHRWRWVNWLLFPGHDQYHLVHHLFPAVPCARFGHVHRLLLEDPSYAAREHDLGRLFAGSRGS